jgi:hypothetical protein
MGRKSQSRGKSNEGPNPDTSAAAPAVRSAPRPTASSMRQWLWRDLQGPLWLFGCMLVGLLLGFSAGAGYITFSKQVAPWKQSLANKARATSTYQFLTFQGKHWDDWLDRFADWVSEVEKDIEMEQYAQNPSHPRVFAVLREAVVREKGGYVHPDLGFLVPAPSGASRGIGMVRDSFHYCQVNCFPGTSAEKYDEITKKKAAEETNSTYTRNDNYKQEEVLVRVPLNFQMTRQVALDTLLALVPADVQKRASLHELDDAALLVLLLANERGVGRNSRWIPYIASLPPEPSCGFSEDLRPYLFDAINAYRHELGMDVQGWTSELVRATQYSKKIAEALSLDYGMFISNPEGVSPSDNINWALCQVASRATAGSDKHGSLRMIPILDLVNHDAHAGGFLELLGQERYRHGDFIETKEEDSGSFVIRSLRHGQRKPLRKGQELLANYNVPHYTPLDWITSMAFVPPELWGQWMKIEPVLPRVRTDGPFSEAASPAAEDWQTNTELVDQLRASDL